MRKWINLVEQIVHKDQFLQPHCSSKTVVAINPSRAEWQANFPQGAGGILLTDGRIVVGSGDCLDHSSILDLAGIDHNLELCRLQVWPTWAHAELWLPHDEHPEERAEGIKQIEEHLGMTVEALEAQLKAILGRFMGHDVPVKGIPKSALDGQPPYQEDDEWLDHHVAASRA